MSSDIERRVTVNVTEPATVDAMIIELLPLQLAQVKIWALAGGMADPGGIMNFYVEFAVLCNGSGTAVIKEGPTDLIAASPLTGIIDVTPVLSTVVVQVQSPFGPNSTARWALRAAIDIIDGVHDAPS